MSRNSIHRTKINLEAHQEVPLTGPPISVAVCRDGDNEAFDLWYEHMEDEVWHHDYAIHVCLTGGAVPWSDAMDRAMFAHLGTVIALDGHHVGHVYVGTYNKAQQAREFQRLTVAK